MAGFDLRGEFLINGVWVDATGNILKRQILEHERGRQDQGQRVDPSTLHPVLRNDSGRWSPDNPMGEYFGVFGRNSQFRLSVKAGSMALDLPGAGNDYASTPDHASLDITGDIDIRVDASLVNWTDSNAALGTVEIVAKLGTTPGTKSWLFGTKDDKLYFEWSADGSNTLSASSTVDLPIPPSGRLAIRVAMDVNTAFGDREVWFYTAPTMAGPWTQLGLSVIDAATTSIANTTTIVRVGDATNFTFGAATGRVHKLEIRNGIDGTAAANPDFTAQAEGTTSFVDAAGRTWTLNGNTSISNRRTRLSQELSAYPARWVPSGKLAWVEAETSGILRRLRRGSTQLDSTLRRRIPSYGPIAYWPMEDGSSATQAASPIAGVKPMRIEPVNWASADTLASSSPLPTLNAGGAVLPTMLGNVPHPGVTLTSWNVQFIYFLETGPAVQRTLLRIKSTGKVAEWFIQSGTGGSTVLGRDSDGVTVFTQGIGTGLDLFGQWVRVNFQASQNGGNVDWRIDWIDVGGDAGGFGTSFAGTVGRPTGVASGSAGFHADLDGMALGHISVWPESSTSAYDGAIDAWAAETAGERMRRLGTEESIPITVCGEVENQEPVGPQLPNASLELLDEAGEADGGILYEDRERVGLRYRDHAGMCNQTPALTLAYAGGVLAPPLDPTGDDDATENDVTVERANGSSARITLAEGTLSVQPAPDGVGPYPTTTTLNLNADEQAANQAGWRLHLGTYEGRRYPEVTIRVHKTTDPALIDQILAIDVGDKLVITGPPIWVAPDDVELIVQGYTERWTSEFTWEITFNCTPGVPWTVGVREGSTPARRGTAGSTLAVAATDVATSLEINTTLGQAWTWKASELPFDVDIAGERMTVTEVSGPDWTFESGVSDWTPTNATFVQSSAQKHSGSFSGLLTVTGSPTQAYTRPTSANQAYVTVGTSYTATIWVYSAAGYGNVAVAIDWYTAAGAYISTSATTVAVAAATWTKITVTGTAPATAAIALYGPTLGSNPPAATALFVDDVEFGPIGKQVFTVTRSVNGVVKAQGVGAEVRLFQHAVRGLSRRINA